MEFIKSKYFYFGIISGLLWTSFGVLMLLFFLSNDTLENSLLSLYNQKKAFTLQNEDNRIIFVIPYKGEFSLIGTTEVDVNTPNNPTISEEEKK